MMMIAANFSAFQANSWDGHEQESEAEIPKKRDVPELPKSISNCGSQTPLRAGFGDSQTVFRTHPSPQFIVDPARPGVPALA
jgi:hypothetical protein